MREKLKSKWQDLGPRVSSAIVLSLIGGAAIFLGGSAFYLLVCICAGLMSWEVFRMAAPERPNLAVAYGVVAGVLLAAAIAIRMPAEWVLFAGLALVLWGLSSQNRAFSATYLFFVMLACSALLHIRAVDLALTVWIVLVVVASDVLGYFVGRSLGGPKFWPAISPKKTWSGTIAGWVGAALVGLIFVDDSPWFIIPVSVLMAFAGQMGDIVESALKRRAGVKDSSNLIPGHGGLLDRFDALMGAAIVLGAALLVVDVIY